MENVEIKTSTIQNIPYENSCLFPHGRFPWTFVNASPTRLLIDWSDYPEPRAMQQLQWKQWKLT